MKLNKLILSLAATATLVSASGAFAQTASQNMNVTATVADLCAIDTTADVAFGNIVTGTSPNYDVAGSVTWRCTSGTSPTISINGGGTGDIANRAMGGTGTNTDTLAYQLYTTTARTNVFGDGTVGNGQTVPGTGAGMATPVTTDIFGRVTNADVAAVSADSYSDVVSVTLTF